MRYLIAIFVSVFAIGCEKNLAPSTPPLAPPDVGTSGGLDITNRTQCNGPPPNGATIFGPGWELVQKLPDNTEVITKLYFFKNSISLFAFCDNAGVTTYTQVSVAAAVDDKSIQVLGTDSQTSDVTDKGITVSCKASLKRTSPFSYTFEGPCLKLLTGKEPVILPPR